MRRSFWDSSGSEHCGPTTREEIFILLPPATSSISQTNTHGAQIMGNQMTDQGEIYRVQAQAAKLLKELKLRIPKWVPAVSMEFTTATFGILGKCSNYAEQLLKSTLFLLICRTGTDESHPQLSYSIDKSTLGEVVRLIKTQQKDCELLQQADKTAVGEFFGLLDRIVVLRNKLIHVKFGGGTSQAEKDLRMLLKSVEHLCNSWLFDELLGTC